MNGYASERAFDRLSGREDFQGYSVYGSYDGTPSGWLKLAKYDKEDYIKYVWDDKSGQWQPSFGLRTLEGLRCAYAPVGCVDGSWHPLDFDENHPYLLGNPPDSLFYFAKGRGNYSILGGSTPIVKRYPSAPKPHWPEPADVPQDSVDEYLTDDGFFKYYEYEYVIENLLLNHAYWVGVTVFDLDPTAIVTSHETAILDNAVLDTAHVPTDVPDPGEPVPQSFEVAQNYPNPFNPTTEIRFSLPLAGETVVEVFNSLGQGVATLVNRNMAAGTHTVEWDGRNDQGFEVASGVYYYRVQSGVLEASRKMVLIR